MHIFSCLNPKIVYNPYLKKEVTVPCGECSACLNHKAYLMIQRLECESQCHNFSYFGTLTYDNEHLPILKHVGDHLIDTNPKRMHWKLGCKDVDVLEELHALHTSSSENSRAFDYIRLCDTNFGGLPYNSSVNLQRFMKRLRKLINKEFKKQSHLHNEKSVPQIRYYIVSEIGPTTYRPHSHFIFFFSSYWLASHLAEFVRLAWQNGNTDTSPISHSASSYVAQYLNCVSNLPTIYRTRSLRPFSLGSKHPALGTLIYNSEDIKQMFLSCSPRQVIWEKKKSLFEDVPLWRSLQNRLYPRLSFFDFLSDRCLHTIYAAYERNITSGGRDTFTSFRKFVLGNQSVTYQDYIKLLSEYKGDFEAKLQRWYLVSKYVCEQSSAWSILGSTYVKCIIDYYNNMRSTELKEWYNYCNDYSQEHDIIDFFWIDKLFLRGLVDSDINDISYAELCYLESFGIDVQKFLSPNSVERLEYQSQFFPENTYDYQVNAFDNDLILFNSTKTKKKNDTQFTKDDWYATLVSHGFQNIESHSDNFIHEKTPF